MFKYDSPFNRFPTNRPKSPGPAVVPACPRQLSQEFIRFGIGRVKVLALGLALALLATGCGSSSSALDRASPQVRAIVADINAANPPLSYRFNYSPISTIFMACLSGVEDVDGVVDAERSIMTLTSQQRPGIVYSLDGELLIHRDLLDGGTGDATFARVQLDAATDQETRNRIDASLGTSLSALVAQGAWPDHPSDTVQTLVASASSITLTAPSQPTHRAIRIVLDQEKYMKEAGATSDATDGIPPIVDVDVAPDGTVQRIVALLPDATQPETIQDHSEGYAIDYNYDPEIDLVPPDPDVIVELDTGSLPDQPTPIPCQLDQ